MATASAKRDASRRLAPRCFRRGGNRDSKHRAAPGDGAQLERRREKISDAPHDRKPKAKPLGLPRAFRQALELLEDRALLKLGDADTAIPNLEKHVSAAPARPDQHAASQCVFDRVR